MWSKFKCYFTCNSIIKSKRGQDWRKPHGPGPWEPQWWYCTAPSLSYENSLTRIARYLILYQLPLCHPKLNQNNFRRSVFSTNLNLNLRRKQFITGEGRDPVKCVFVAAKSATHHLVETTQNPLVIPVRLVSTSNDYLTSTKTALKWKTLSHNYVVGKFRFWSAYSYSLCQVIGIFLVL